MANMKIDARWQNWVKENIERGCNPDDLRAVLKQNQFSPTQIEKLMRNHPATTVAKVVLTPEQYNALAHVKITRTATRIPTDLLQIYQLDDFMTAQECAELIALSSSSMRPSSISYQEQAQNAYFRTSSTCDLAYLSHPLITKIDQRIADALGVNVSYSEGTQIQRYEVGQLFKDHTDYFEPGSEEYSKFASKQGNRTWTFMVYLNDTTRGGGTHFSKLGQTFYPRTGRALVWNNLLANGTPNPNTIHAGQAVEEGNKVIITKWFREVGSGRMIPAED